LVQDTSKPKPKLLVRFPVQTQFGSVPNRTSATLDSDPPAYSESSSSLSESEQSLPENNIETLVVTPKKRKRTTAAATRPTTAGVDKSITYILAILSADEIKKAIAKCSPKTLTLQLTTDEPWDTVKVQLLVKISQALNPKVVDHNNYTVTFFIPCIFTKPSAPLHSDDNYKLLLHYYSKCTPGKEQPISVVITENADAMAKDKENEDPTTKQGKKVCIHTLASLHH
jgi:hypothetical protein